MVRTPRAGARSVRAALLLIHRAVRDTRTRARSYGGAMVALVSRSLSQTAFAVLADSCRLDKLSQTVRRAVRYWRGTRARRGANGGGSGKKSGLRGRR